MLLPADPDDYNSATCSRPICWIVEVIGGARKDKAAKVAAARNLWVPAVNNHGAFGRWAVVDVTDPWDAMTTIRAALREVMIET